MTTQFIPQTEATGGTAVGNSYITTWAACPRDWYNLFYRPVISVEGEHLGTGLTFGYTSIPLLVGRIFHEGLARWYESGCRDGEDTGERSLDAALDRTQEEFQACRGQFPADPKAMLSSEEVAQLELDKLEVMLRAYHDRFGPDSHAPEFPTIKVLCDGQGKPLVEREWQVQLCPGYVYTCRTDLIVREHGLLKTMEHKTTTAYGVQARRREMDMDSQFTSEYWVLGKVLPQETLAGVMVNMILKNRSGNSKYDVAERETTTRTQGQLERWRKSAVAALSQIDDAVGMYEDLVPQVGHEEASEQCFPDHGTRTGRCYAYNSRCQFLDLCQMAGMEHKRLVQYRPRFPIPTEDTE